MTETGKQLFAISYEKDHKVAGLLNEWNDFEPLMVVPDNADLISKLKSRVDRYNEEEDFDAYRLGKDIEIMIKKFNAKGLRR